MGKSGPYHEYRERLQPEDIRVILEATSRLAHTLAILGERQHRHSDSPLTSFTTTSISFITSSTSFITTLTSFVTFSTRDETTLTRDETTLTRDELTLTSFVMNLIRVGMKLTSFTTKLINFVLTLTSFRTKLVKFATTLTSDNPVGFQKNLKAFRKIWKVRRHHPISPARFCR